MAQPLTGPGDPPPGPGGAPTDPPPVVPPPIGPGRAAVLFARLRLRFLLNGLRTGGRVTVQSLLSLLSLPIVAGFGILLAVALRAGDSDGAVTVLTVFAALMGLAALMGPALLTGHDDSLNPERLAPYPLTRRAQLAGLAAATAVRPISVGTAVAVLALAAGATRTLAGAPLAVVAAVELWVLLTVTSRVLATALAGLATTRRGRDLNLALSALVAATAWAWGPLTRALSQVDEAQQSRIARLARWTPPGALGAALGRAGSGAAGAALPGMAFGLVGIAVAGALWWLALGRVASTVGGGSGASAVTPAEGVPVGLFGGWLRWLPRSDQGAVAARELRLLTRDPRRRISLITLGAAAVVLPVVNLAQTHPPPWAVLGSAFAGLVVSFSGFNQLGTDGRALWVELLSGQPPLANLRGRGLASLVTLAPVTLLANLALAALLHGWAWFPAAALTGWSVLVLGLGAAAIASVTAPAAVPERGSPFAAAQGQGCLAGLLALAAMAVVSVLLVPTAAALVVLHDRPVACVLVGLVSLAYASGLRELGLRQAARRMTAREPELLAAVMPRD